MKLLNLHLENFKGLRDFTLDSNGENLNIYGDNATGKTTVFDAIIWLLFDKNSEDKKNFNIKTIVDGKEMHQAEHSVEAIFEVNDTQLTLKKIYKEKWVKSKGKLEPEFTGNTVECFIDNVPKKANDYKRYIDSIIDEKIFKLLTNPLYFNEQLSWQERRTILMELCGNITDEDVISKNDSLAELPALLQGRSIDDFKTMLKASIAKTKKQIENIAPAIKENIHNIVPTESTISDLDSVIKALINKQSELRTQLASVKSLDAASVIIREMDELSSEILKIENSINSKENASRKEAIAKNQSIDKQINQAKKTLADIDNNIKDNDNTISMCNKAREKLITEFTNVKGQMFKMAKIITTCPYCGQDIPTEKVEEAKAKQQDALEQFNLDKAELLKSINEKGKKNNEILAKAKTDNEVLQAQYSKLSDEIENMAKLYVTNDSTTKYPEEYFDLQKQYKALEQRLAEPKLVNDKVLKLNSRIDAFTDEIDKKQSILAIAKQNERLLKRNSELEDREKELSVHYAELTKQLYLADEFTRSKTELIDAKVSSLFDMARFNLFKPNISNDGIEECCEATYQGIPYSDLNNAARINIGLDIIKVLSKKYNVTAPVIIDNAESVTHLELPDDIQVIRLVVSEPDKVLRIEKEIIKAKQIA